MSSDNGSPSSPEWLARLGHFFWTIVTSASFWTAILGFITGSAVTTLLETEEAILKRYPELTYYFFKEEYDVDEALRVEVPAEWDAVSRDERLPFGDLDVGPALVVSRLDTGRWYATWEESGLFFGTSKALLNIDKDELDDDDGDGEKEVTEEEITSAAEPDEQMTDDDIFRWLTGAPLRCSEESVNRKWTPHDRDYTVTYRAWENCTESGNDFVMFVSRPKDREHAQCTNRDYKAAEEECDNQDFVAVGELTIAREGDWEARQRFFDSFTVQVERIPEPEIQSS